MFFMARAAPPILPGWVVFTNTMRMLSNAGAVIVGSHAVGIARLRTRHRKRRAFYHEHYVRKPRPGARTSKTFCLPGLTSPFRQDYSVIRFEKLLVWWHKTSVHRCA